MSKHFVTVLKLVFVAALLWFVLSNVSWQDSHVAGPKGAKITTIGKILGDWDKPEVQFLPADKTEPIVVPEAQIRPGILTYVRDLNWGWFSLGAFCYILATMFAATRWWWLLRVNKLPIGWFAAVKFSWIGIFFNNIIPGQTGGDLVKAIYVMKRSHGARVPAMMSVVVDRIMGLASLALLAAIAVLFYLDRENFEELALALWAILGGVVLLGVVAFSRRVRSAIRLTDLLEKLPEKLSMLLKRIDHAVYFYRGHKGGMALWMLGGMVNHVASVFSYAFIGKALGVGIPVIDYFVLIPIIIIVSAIPIAPNGWGVGEFMFQKLFGEFGAPYLPGVSVEEAVKRMGDRGVVLSIVHRVHLMALSLIGGILFFFDKDKVTREDMERESAAEEVEEAKLDEEMHAAELAAERGEAAPREDSEEDSEEGPEADSAEESGEPVK